MMRRRNVRWGWLPAAGPALLALLLAACRGRPREGEPAADAAAPGAGTESDATSGAGAAADSASPPTESAALVIAQNAGTLMGIPGVTGVYEGATDGHTVLRVMVRSRADSTLRRIPRTLGGYRVEIEVSGPIRPLGH